MAFYTSDYGSRYTTNTRDSNEVNISSLETQLSDLTSLVIQLVCKEPQQQFQQRTPYNPNQATSSSQGMSLENIVKSLATNTLQFQQKTEASIQNLGAQMTQLATSVSRLEAQIEEKLGSMDKKRLETSLEEEDEEEDTNLSISRDADKKGEDVNVLEPMVVPPPFLMPIVDLIKEEEEHVDIWETFTELEEPMVDGKKVTPGDGAFADLQREVSLKCKGPAFEIRTDFKAPQHVEKKHVWDIDLLDTG